MIYFDSDMSKSTNTVVYFDGKTVIYIAENVAHNLSCQWKSQVTFIGACANEIIPLINCSFVYKAKEGGNVGIHYIQQAMQYSESRQIQLTK